MATLVEGDSKAPFLIATTPRCRGGCYSFSWIALFYPWSLPYNAECWARRHQVPFFKFLVWLSLGLNLGHPDHWQTLYSLGQCGMMVRVFANGSGDLGSIPGQVILKTQKMVLDASLLNTQHYKVWIEGKVEPSRERSSTLSYTLVQ